MRTPMLTLIGLVLATVALGIAAPVRAVSQQLGALAPENLARPRPEPPFNLTGTWQHDIGQPGSWRFIPPEFTLTPDAQQHYNAGQAALAEGKVYRDDIGQCWPSGLPLIMTRVWPIAMIQLPTAIYTVSNFMNSLRVIYLNDREHTDPDLVVPSFNGESIGRWEGETLVVDTRFFPEHHHWMDQGGASIPASDELHIVERVRLADDGARLEIEYTMTDPKSWEGEWVMTKWFDRQDGTDITEVECWPDLNDYMKSTTSSSQVR